MTRSRRLPSSWKVETGKEIEASAHDVSENHGDWKKLLPVVSHVLLSKSIWGEGVRNSVPVGPIGDPGGRIFHIHDAVSVDCAEGGRFQGGQQSFGELFRRRSLRLPAHHFVGLSSLRRVSFGKDCFHCGPLLEFRSGRAMGRRAVDLVELERISFPEGAFPSVTILIFQSRAWRPGAL